MNQNIRTIGIVGTGMIASSMAVLCTGHGFRTIVYARSEKSAKKCLDSYAAAYAQLIKHGMLTEQQYEICKSYLNIVYDYSGLKDAECVFECVKEDAEVKHDVYRQIEQHCNDMKAICSVSSSIIPEILSEGMQRYADRIIVTHPFNPAHMVPYFELCGSKHTAEGVIDYAVGLLEELDRKPVVLKKPAPGFIGNRLQFALWREALAIVQSGIADPKDVDACLNYSFCPRYTSIGIFENFDSGGLDLNYAVAKTLFPVLSNAETVSPLITDKIEAGNLGQKTGVGFYDWRETDMDAYRARVNEPFWKFCNWKLPEE